MHNRLQITMGIFVMIKDGKINFTKPVDPVKAYYLLTAHHLKKQQLQQLILFYHPNNSQFQDFRHRQFLYNQL